MRASYALAIEQGADYIEPDLVSTRDGVLIARHEVDITDTTDVAAHPAFASRRTTKTIDGITTTGWFADDFTLAEIRTLRAVQRLAFRPQQYNGLYRIPTFAEVIELAQSAKRLKGHAVGVYPETKHPTYHQSVGLPLERRLLTVLDRYGWNHRHAPVYIQSFEVANLKQPNRQTSARLVQLIDANDVRLDGSIDSDGYGPFDFVAAGDRRTYADLVTPAGLAEIATYADGAAPGSAISLAAAPPTRIAMAGPMTSTATAGSTTPTAPPRSPRSLPTRTTPGSSCTPTRGATKRSTCSPTTATTRCRSISSSSASASTASSATTPTPRRRRGRCSG